MKISDENRNMKVSLITVAKDCADVIGRTIDSVYNQTYDNIEYIIVDGSRGDEIAAVVATWKSRFGCRLRYIHETDGGVYDALNKGISMASGDVIGMIHADDVFSGDEVVENVMESMNGDEELDLVYGDVHYVSKNNYNHVLRYYSGSDFRRGCLRLGYAPPHPSMYCRRSVFERYELYNEEYRVAGDFDMFVRLLWSSSVKAKYLPIDMVAMTMGGISTQWRNRIFLNNYEKRKALRDNGVRSSYILLLLRYLLNLMQYFKAK